MTLAHAAAFTQPTAEASPVPSASARSGAVAPSGRDRAAARRQTRRLAAGHATEPALAAGAAPRSPAPPTDPAGNNGPPSQGGDTHAGDGRTVAVTPLQQMLDSRVTSVVLTVLLHRSDTATAAAFDPADLLRAVAVVTRERGLPGVTGSAHVSTRQRLACLAAVYLRDFALAYLAPDNPFGSDHFRPPHPGDWQLVAADEEHGLLTWRSGDLVVVDALRAVHEGRPLLTPAALHALGTTMEQTRPGPTGPGGRQEACRMVGVRLLALGSPGQSRLLTPAQQRRPLPTTAELTDLARLHAAESALTAHTPTVAGPAPFDVAPEATAGVQGGAR